jgi:hypothetical protein
VAFYDQSTGQTSSFFTENYPIGTSDLQIYTALEGYEVNDNTDVPGDTTFSGMTFKDLSLNPVDITWVERVEPDPHYALTGLDVDIISDSQVILRTAN